MVSCGQPGCLSGCAPIPGFGSVSRRSWAAGQSMHPPEVSCVGTQAADRVCTLPAALGRCTQAAGLLIWVCTNWASGVCWGCLSSVHSPGAEGVGVQEARAAAGEFSKQLLSASIFSFSFREILPIQAPCSKQALGLSHSPAWLSPKNPAADPVPRCGLQPLLSLC